MSLLFRILIIAVAAYVAARVPADRTRRFAPHDFRLFAVLARHHRISLMFLSTIAIRICPRIRKPKEPRNFSLRSLDILGNSRLLTECATSQLPKKRRVRYVNKKVAISLFAELEWRYSREHSFFAKRREWTSMIWLPD